MNYAFTISDLPNVFKSTPLSIDELTIFYRETMAVRTGYSYDSPLEDIYDSCKQPSEQNAFLLLGHRGCGKSTELNRLADRLTREGYPVAVVECQQESDVTSLAYSDVMILMGDALLRLADKYNCPPPSEDLELIRNFWIKTEEFEKTSTDEAIQELKAGGGIDTPALFNNILSFFIKMKSSMKYNVESRTIYREKVIRHSSQWLDAINRLGDKLTEAREGKQPVLIFEDLDKGETWDVFSGHGEHLTGVTFPVIYTFPIALSYKPEFAEMEIYFEIKRLPMIKIKTLKGEPFEQGRKAILDIIRARTDTALFESGVLDLLIKSTGGSLRHLFNAISKAAIISRRKGISRIDEEAAKIALEEIKTSLSSRVEGADHSFLVEICKGKHQEITDRQKLLEMMQAQVVLEYNSRRWHDVHPLIEEYLNELGLLTN